MALNQCFLFLKPVILYDTSVCHAHKILFIKKINRAGGGIHIHIEASFLNFVALYFAKLDYFVGSTG